MDEVAFPIIIARNMLAALPKPVIERGAAALMRSMRRHHPDLFRNLAALQPTRLQVELTDLPHRFLLSFGEKPATLTLVRGDAPACNVTLKGSLESLLALLEGRIDSDALFFTREITITGDTSAVVALRNTLDREEISLMDEAMALLGPLRGVGRRTVLRWEGRAARLRDRIIAMRAPDAPDEHDLAAEFGSLRAEIETLKSRLAKQEILARRKQGVAA